MLMPGNLTDSRVLKNKRRAASVRDNTVTGRWSKQRTEHGLMASHWLIL